VAVVDAATAPVLAGALMTRRYLEDQIQSACVAYLRTVLLNCRVFTVPNGRTNAREGARQKRLGALAGVPDVLIVVPGGKVYFLEFKAPGGSLSESQKGFHDWAIFNGVPSAVIMSIDQIKIAIREWQLPTRESKQ
jgi:hypothetical protein